MTPLGDGRVLAIEPHGEDSLFVVACPNEKFWVRLTEFIGQPELAEDDRFDSFATRRTIAAELLGILDGIFAGGRARRGWRRCGRPRGGHGPGEAWRKDIRQLRPSGTEHRPVPEVKRLA